MPTSTTHANLIRIACGSCTGGPSTLDVPLGGALAAGVRRAGHAPDTNKTVLVNELKLKVEETRGVIANLFAEQNLVSVLLQTSNFVLFLESQETLPAYGTQQNRLSDVKGRLVQVKCGARELLTLSDAEIQSIVTEHVQHTGILNELAGASGGMKRAVCAVVLEMMTTYLENIDLD
ncbi:hypothetical protein ElyMa_001170900 [Elysia marginata]|uniref:Uncharacterized protein n=1 Tax=Elysia marginata TaxID=1093978 RepID=A0AAV4I5I0_9GAST|nr:hypothetical protein ElyMa_001170900 [Elysia marginata]